MNFGRLLVIPFGTSHCWPTRLSAAFVSRLSEVFDFACLLAGLGRLASSLFVCFVSFFHLLSSHFSTCFARSSESTCFVFQLAWCFDLLRVSTCFIFDPSTAFRPFWHRLVCSRRLWLRALALKWLTRLGVWRSCSRRQWVLNVAVGIWTRLDRPYAIDSLNFWCNSESFLANSYAMRRIGVKLVIPWAKRIWFLKDRKQCKDTYARASQGMSIDRIRLQTCDLKGK
jgi:hypothetical protein